MKLIYSPQVGRVGEIVPETEVESGEYYFLVEEILGELVVTMDAYLRYRFNEETWFYEDSAERWTREYSTLQSLPPDTLVRIQDETIIFAHAD